MPTTVARWLESFAEAFADCLPLLEATARVVDQNPLGSMSGFGVEQLTLDRDMTAAALGFSKVQRNPLYCGLSRGMFELAVLQALTMPMTVCSRFASDMMQFTMQETQFLALPAEFTTGSSVMPQKRNYDCFEIMRGNSKSLAARMNEVNTLLSHLGSGYHRDLQLTKRPLVEGVALTVATLQLLGEAVDKLVVHHDALRRAMTPELYATEKVYEKVTKEKIPFRDAYMQVKDDLQRGKKFA
eukprot:Selendium_serpulae@DN5463_c0_g1_i4.p1